MRRIFLTSNAVRIFIDLMGTPTVPAVNPRLPAVIHLQAALMNNTSLYTRESAAVYPAIKLYIQI
jgi:hypothetical protein